jgi:integrase
MRTVFSALRSFLRFAENQGLTENCPSSTVPGSWGRKTAIIPTITFEEEQKLLSAVDRTRAVGKRDYAMLLLALRTGLRSIDIINLKMKDIDWKRSTIAIIQEKTNTPLMLPLLADVGNALADYILNGRPDSNLPHLFLRTQAPFRNLSSRSNCYGISCKIMKEAGIRQGQEDRKGFHCLRHSVAARLLAEATPLPVISSILGHRDKDSTKVYLSTDLEHLRFCALNLSGIEVNREELR